MKISLLCAAVSLTAMSLPAFAANDGTINFNGDLTATTCKVEGQAPGGGSVNKTVELGSVPVSVLSDSGSASESKFFDIKVGGTGDAGCTNGTMAKVRFDPASPAINPETGNLKVDTAAGAATGVEVRIFDHTTLKTTPINLLTEESTSVEVTDNQATLPFRAEYFSAAGGATAGPAETRVGFQVVYD